ncbi:MAG: hypothetical protein AAB632_01115 [Patescibacteria group bacterium]
MTEAGQKKPGMSLDEIRALFMENPDDKVESVSELEDGVHLIALNGEPDLSYKVLLYCKFMDGTLVDTGSVIDYIHNGEVIEQGYHLRYGKRPDELPEDDIFQISAREAAEYRNMVDYYA